jgi:hypothetical protein
MSYLSLMNYRISVLPIIVKFYLHLIANVYIIYNFCKLYTLYVIYQARLNMKDK